jgi:hypothetical protein
LYARSEANELRGTQPPRPTGEAITPRPRPQTAAVHDRAQLLVRPSAPEPWQGERGPVLGAASGAAGLGAVQTTSCSAASLTVAAVIVVRRLTLREAPVLAPTR